jgi:hypothetical protein
MEEKSKLAEESKREERREKSKEKHVAREHSLPPVPYLYQNLLLI